MKTDTAMSCARSWWYDFNHDSCKVLAACFIYDFDQSSASYHYYAKPLICQSSRESCSKAFISEIVSVICDGLPNSYLRGYMSIMIAQNGNIEYRLFSIIVVKKISWLTTVNFWKPIGVFLFHFWSHHTHNSSASWSCSWLWTYMYDYYQPVRQHRAGNKNWWYCTYMLQILVWCSLLHLVTWGTVQYSVKYSILYTVVLYTYTVRTYMYSTRNSAVQCTATAHIVNYRGSHLLQLATWSRDQVVGLTRSVSTQSAVLYYENDEGKTFQK